ncbi:MAG: branched-chain amino acid ABC transporter permease [Acidimicrobiales bacterium]
MERFLQYFFDGLSQGSIYALIALGVVIIYRGSGHLNFAQGEMAMISAFIAWWYADLGLSPWLAVGVASVTAFVAAMGIERFIIRPIGHKSPFAVVVASIGLFLGMNALAPFAWKVTIPQAYEALFPDKATDFVRIGGAEWREQNIGVLLVLAVIAGALYLLFQRTRFGLAMRAVASNPESAPLVGIRTGQVLAVSWGLAAAVGAVGGAMVASLRGNVDASMMFTIFFAAVAAATLGGYDSLIGAVFGGITLGIFENMVAGYQPDVVGQELKGVVSLVVILAVLLVRPSGLFGTRRVERV